MSNVSINRSQNDKLTEVTIGSVTVWFSYETAIAFQKSGQSRVISTNVFGTTTGRHINSIDPRKEFRIERAQFERELDAL